MTDQEIKEKAINDVATAYGINPERLRRFLEDVLSPPTFKPTLDEKKIPPLPDSLVSQQAKDSNSQSLQTL